MRKDDERLERLTAAEERHAAAVERIEQLVRALHTKPREERTGSVEGLHRFPALRVALRYCRDVEAGEGLVQRFVRVPESHVRAAERVVTCVCGAEVPFGDLKPCPGSCGRYFAADGSGAFVARFTKEMADAA
jgi:hypothetical protein